MALLSAVVLQTLMLLAFLTNSLNAKIYGRCELAGALLARGVRGRDIARWVCIAFYSSGLNSNLIVQHLMEDVWEHGLWQISDKYWVGRDGPGGECGYSGEQVRFDNLNNAVNCIKQIFAKTQSTELDGWLAWPVYATQGRCKGDVSSWVSNCFLV